MEDGRKMINILYEDNHLLVVEKPVNMPVQEDSSHDMDLLTLLKNDLKKRYHKPGNVYLGLVHRLDRPVGGVMVFAKTSKAASRLSEQVRMHKMLKEYDAVVEGKIEKQGVLKDRLYKDTKRNMVIVDPRGKEAELSYQLKGRCEDYSLVHITLKTGRSHQIRVQFSSRNHPLYGDQRYNKHATPGEQIALFASRLSFYHPTTKEYLSFSLPLPNRVPWTMFKENR